MENNKPTSTEFAGFGLRFLAYSVDLLILFFIGLVVQSLFGNSVFDYLRADSVEEINRMSQGNNPLLQLLVGLIISALFYVIPWVSFNGATPGKKLLAIKVVKEDGLNLTYASAIPRWFGFLLSSITIIFFGFGFLMALFTKKKQTLHDKIAGTIVVKTEKKPHLGWGIALASLSVILLFGYYTTMFVKGFMLGLKEAQKQQPVLEQQKVQEKVQQNILQDKEKILTYAPTSCGLKLAVPKTTDTIEGVQRKWILEEVPLTTESFYILNKDIFNPKEVNGVFLGYKKIDSRLEGSTFLVAYPGINVYCAENTKGLTLEEYKALALTNKDYTVTINESVYWGEVPLEGITVEGVMSNGEPFKDIAYIGVTEDNSKLLYIRVWDVSEKDPNYQDVSSDVNIIVRNLLFRSSSPSEKNSGDSLDVNFLQPETIVPKVDLVK